MIKYSIKDLHYFRQALNYSFNFSQDNKTYKPLMPLTQQYNLIYASPRFTKDVLNIKRFNFLYFIPAGFMAINNFLTDWNLAKSILFIVLFMGGVATKISVHAASSLQVCSVQIDPNIQNLYVTLYKSPLTFEIRRLVGNLSQFQEAKLMESYHPLVEKKPNSGIVKTKNQFISQYFGDPQFKNLLKIQNKFLRIKMPLSRLKISLILKGRLTEAELQRDLQRLSLRQLLKKYQNCGIQIKIKGNQASPAILKINPENNINRKYHDYLICLGLGLRIDTSANVAKDDEQNN